MGYRSKKDEENRSKLLGQRRQGAEQDDMTAIANEASKLRQANQDLDNILGQGGSILGNLVNQNQTLKNAKKKLLDVASAIGVSKSLVSVIDRRQTADKWLVYGGMILTLFILFSLWYL